MRLKSLLHALMIGIALVTMELFSIPKVQAQTGIRQLHVPKQSLSFAYFTIPSISVSSENQVFDLLSLSYPALPSSAKWQYEQLAFFCKVEVKIEKLTTFPVKMRLGSVPYVDYLEGKK